ncbi:hypothetical protein ACRAWF_46930 [Streptomyces sp. L7]
MDHLDWFAVSGDGSRLVVARRGRTPSGPLDGVRRRRLDRLDRPAPHPARGRPARRMAPVLRRRRAA